MEQRRATSSRKRTAPKRPASPQRNRSQSKARKVVDLDRSLLTQRAQSVSQREYLSPYRYQNLDLHPQLLAALAKKGFDQPTEIQDLSREPLLAGRDLMGIAQTGTGKTGAFLIPMIDRLLRGKKAFQSLILAPTRELAVQIEAEFKSLTHGMSFSVQCYIGGTSMNRDLQKVRRRADLVVATPGRLLDLHQRGVFSLDAYELLILDEFDRMLDMGFAKDVRRITKALSKRKHTLLFSATHDPAQQSFIDELLHNPVVVKVSQGDSTTNNVDQDIVEVGPDQNKFDVLLDMVQKPQFTKVLIFAETKRWVSRVTQKLQKAGLEADEIHGNKSQNYRQRALTRFKSGSIQILVATDVAARGLDVQDISHVINFQMPSSADSYIHRIGRTGRAGKSGQAYTFVS